MKSKDVTYIGLICDQMRRHGASRFTLDKSQTQRRVILRGWNGDKMVMERNVHICRYRQHATRGHSDIGMKKRCETAYQRFSEVLFHYLKDNNLLT